MPPDNSKVLSKQEIEIVQGLADGQKANRLARQLKISEERLAVILSHLRLEYNCENSTHLVAYFLRNKLIQ